MQKPTDWTHITIGFDGRAVNGSYSVEGGMLIVKGPRGQITSQIEEGLIRFGRRCAYCVIWRRQEKHKKRALRPWRREAACHLQTRSKAAGNAGQPTALPCPHTCRVGACQVHVHGNVGCRTNTGASLHGPTADKHTLSLAPLPPIFAFNRFLDGPRRREAASSHLSFLANFDPDQCACS